MKEHYAIWSDDDLADDLILGAEEKTESKIVICLNQIVNDIFRAYGLKPASLKWNFIHAYSENIGHIEPADWLKKANEVAEQKGHEETI